MGKFVKVISSWAKKNKREFFLLLAIILVATILRLWRIDEYLPFLGDEGRDVRVVRRLIVDFDPILIGPRTSIGDMYLGPLYYYLIAPFLAVFGLSPVGPAVLVALLGVTTVWFIWYIGRQWFGRVAALTASFLFAIAPVVIVHARHSWNPNIMPFFALVAIYSIWRVWQHHELRWSLVLAVAFAFVLQSHYLGLLLLPTIVFFWLLTFWQLRSKKIGNWKLEIGKFLRMTLIAGVIFAGLMSPLVIFDARHGWRNFSAMKKFFSERQTTVSARPWNALPRLWPIWSENVAGRLVVAKNNTLAPVAAALLLGGVIWLAKNPSRPLLLLGSWIFFGLVGLGLYKQSIFDHYFGFMFVAPFLLVGGILQEFWERKIKWLVIVILVGLALVNLGEVPLKYPPQRQMQRVQEIDKKIIAESGGAPFNFGLIAKRNYEESYLYFFELWGAPVREIDAQRSEETITSQLFVVCEDPKEKDLPDPCNPINHAKAEIANFGWARVENEWPVGGFRLFKLVHAK